MLAFAASTLEVLIPDVHDGDAQTLAVAGRAHGEDGATRVPHDMPAAPHHAQHVDHCTHAHVAAASAPVEIDAAPDCVQPTPNSRSLALVSVAGATSLRPPITL